MPLIPVSPGISQSGENPLAWTDDLRGINGMVSATRATSTGVKVMRGSPGITWTRVGNSMRYHPTVGYTAFDATLNSLANADPEIRVIIDPHEDFPGFPRTDTSHADNPFWFYPDCQANAVELWTDIANHYKNWGTIIGGYDLVNEPTCPYWNANSSRYPEVFTTASAAAAPAAGVTWSQLMDAWDLVGWTYSTTVPAYTVDQPDPRSWNKLCRRCAEAIRATGDMHPIVISLSNRGGTNPADPDTPTDGGTGINMGTFQRAKDVPNEFVDMSEFEDIVYTVHSYGPETANNSTDPPRIVPWQTNGWNQDPRPSRELLQADLQEFFDWAAAHPTFKIYIGEMGPRFDLMDSDTFAADQFDMFSSRGWTWGVHLLRNDNTTGTFNVARDPDLFEVCQTYWNKLE